MSDCSLYIPETDSTYWLDPQIVDLTHTRTTHHITPGHCNAILGSASDGRDIRLRVLVRRLLAFGARTRSNIPTRDADCDQFTSLLVRYRDTWKIPRLRYHGC
jgi:hypothetical protein